MSQNPNSGSLKTNKRRHVDSLSSDEDVSQDVANSWPRFIVISSSDGNPLKLNPFAVSKGIQSVCGEVKNVTHLRNGSLLVECARRQQSVNLLGLQQFVNTQVVVSVHKSLNSCRGIVRDRAKCLSDMTEDEIAAALTHQGVTSVKRFTRKQYNNVIKTNTYLFTFRLSAIPTSIKAGYFNIGVEVYIPNPLRCFKCQQFGHGANTCTRNIVCLRCSGAHENPECTNDIKCANCDGPHLASSKSCPKFEYQSTLLKIKHTNNISFSEAKKFLPNPSQNPTVSYSAALSSVPVPKVTTKSISCQTDISWVTDQRVTLGDTPMPPPSQTSSSASQTEMPTQGPSDPTSEPTSEQEVETVNQKKKKKKQLKKQARTLQHLEVPQPLDPTVTVHNPFDPLDMDVTPSHPVHGSDHSTRPRSPVEPP
ncbi:uncharacterized protein [Haliotis cracherodii]|uniref:uncharacterized protein n=1 Tax=Haliotis cracherodii TaxID=6455 RepID=UPI0039ED251F